MNSQALCVLFCFSVFVNLTADGLQSDSCSTVHLIHVVPSSDNEELSEWNKTELYVLQSAKQLALSNINSRSDLLPGIKLEIVDVSILTTVHEILLCKISRRLLNSLFLNISVFWASLVCLLQSNE